MKHSDAANKATRSIWSLTVIGLMAGCLLLGLEEKLGRYVASSHQESAQDQESTNFAIESLSKAVEFSDARLHEILNGALPASESIAALMEQAEASLTELDHFHLSPRLITQQYLEIEAQIRAWRKALALAEVRFEVEFDGVQDRIAQLRARTQSATDTQRLARAVELAEYRRLGAESAAQAAAAIMAKLDQGVDLGVIQSELSELDLSVQRLTAEDDPDHLLDLRNQHFIPILQRLHVLEAKAVILGKDANEGLRAVSDLEAALFGTNFLHGEAQQMIVLGSGGLFRSTRDLLALDRDHTRLDASLTALHNAYSEERVRMIAESRDRASESLAKVLEATVAARLRTLPVVLLAALAFVLLARSIARALREQVRDLSESNRKTVKALSDLELTQRSIPSILIGMDAEQRISSWNVHASTTLDTPESTVIGRSMKCVTLEWDLDRLNAALDECSRSYEIVTVDALSFTTRGGRRGSLELRISPKIGDDGGLHGLLIVGKDIQEDLDMEDQLAQARKLESIGQLAAGIAHEINTPTQYATDNVQFLGDATTDLLRVAKQLREVLGDATASVTWPAEEVASMQAKLKEADLEFLLDEVPKSIEQCLEGLGTVASIVGAMKEFSHPGVTQKSMVELNRSIESTVAVARNEWKYVADIELELEADLPLVPCVQGEMNQVFLNLLVNAAHAIVDGCVDGGCGKGKITIGTSSSPGWVEVCVSDSGCGIPDNVLERIFDPFFTTKDIGRGTGQGLAIARSVVVDKHQGSLRVESVVGEGTTFMVRLPLEAVANAA